jgi:FMN reductase
MLDFRTIVVPRFVYATGAAFAAGRLIDPEQARRVTELARMTAKLAHAVGAIG